MKKYVKNQKWLKKLDKKHVPHAQRNFFKKLKFFNLKKGPQRPENKN